MNIAIIFAGGTGTRMNSKDRPKQFLELFHKPIIIHTLEVFEDHPDIDAIVVSCIDEWIGHLDILLHEYHIEKVKRIVPGGKTGQESIYNGLVAAKEIVGENAIVLIHDGVRPMITKKLLTDNIETVKKHGAAITTGLVTETLLEINEESERIDRVPERKRSRIAKAPQSFFLDDILKVHKKAIAENKHDFIDSCTMMSYYGYPLHLVDGPRQNIKITTQEDFYLMRAILEARENEQLYTSTEVIEGD